MPRNDGVDRTLARNIDIKTPDLARIQAHNERQNDVYSNRDTLYVLSAGIMSDLALQKV